ncbi:hypothetical protein HDU67_007793 [Dinochytrium kinnereticum]|nr:hypothetical protein HDU67_007793 [Dinochytrium kinnereticum]
MTIGRSDTVNIPKRSKTIAPTIAAFGDDGNPLDDGQLAYQGGEGEDKFVQETADDDGEPPEAIQWVVLAPGELPPDVDISEIPKHYLPEEAARLQKEEEDKAKKEEEDNRKAKIKLIYGTSNPNLAEVPIPVGIDAVIDPLKTESVSVAGRDEVQ